MQNMTCVQNSLKDFRTCDLKYLLIVYINRNEILEELSKEKYYFISKSNYKKYNLILIQI